MNWQLYSWNIELVGFLKMLNSEENQRCSISQSFFYQIHYCDKTQVTNGLIYTNIDLRESHIYQQQCLFSQLKADSIALFLSSGLALSILVCRQPNRKIFEYNNCYSILSVKNFFQFFQKNNAITQFFFNLVIFLRMSADLMYALQIYYVQVVVNYLIMLQ